MLCSKLYALCVGRKRTWRRFERACRTIRACAGQTDVVRLRAICNRVDFGRRVRHGDIVVLVISGEGDRLELFSALEAKYMG